jgi:hypothetical protein
MIERYDEREIYCRKLGHCLSFGYCRATHSGLPCGSIVSCWNGRIPLEQFLSEHYPDHLERILAPPPPKLVSLVETIQRVEARRKEADEAAGG